MIWSVYTISTWTIRLESIVYAFYNDFLLSLLFNLQSKTSTFIKKRSVRIKHYLYSVVWAYDSSDKLGTIADNCSLVIHEIHVSELCKHLKLNQLLVVNWSARSDKILWGYLGNCDYYKYFILNKKYLKKVQVNLNATYDCVRPCVSVSLNELIDYFYSIIIYNPIPVNRLGNYFLKVLLFLITRI